MTISKGKRLVLISHCILNQNSVVDSWERSEGAYPISTVIIESGVGIIQLPCPEFFIAGLNRPSMTYEEYNTEENRGLIRNILDPIIHQVTSYLDHGYSIVGLIGIHESPNCSLTGQPGVFMEELLQQLKKIGLDLPFFEISPNYGIDPSESNQQHLALKEFLRS